MLFYLGRYTIKLLSTEISVHTGNIRLECRIKYFLVWNSSSVNKNVTFSPKVSQNQARVSVEEIFWLRISPTFDTTMVGKRM